MVRNSNALYINLNWVYVVDFWCLMIQSCTLLTLLILLIFTVSERDEVHAECKLADTFLDFEHFFLPPFFSFLMTLELYYSEDNAECSSADRFPVFQH